MLGVLVYVGLWELNCKTFFYISLDRFEFLFSKGVASWSGRSGNKGSEALYGCE